MTETVAQPAPTASVEASIFPGIPDRCIRSVQEPPKDHFGNDVILLDKPNIIGNDSPGLYMLDMATGVPTKLSGKYDVFSRASVTPDRSLASVVGTIYGATPKSEVEHLLLITADGKVIKELPMPKRDNWFYMPTWINNQALVMDDFDDTFIIWDPFTQEKYTLLVDYPTSSGDWVVPVPYWGEPWGKRSVEYSPSLSRLVYLGEKGITFNLWDVEKKRNILSWVFYGNDYQPRWSPDGAHFIMVGALGDLTNTTSDRQEKVYLADNNGKTSVLLNDMKGIQPGAYFWSASGRYIAFLFSKKSFEDYLVIMDTQTLEITNTCIKVTLFNLQTSLTWSPDETQILLKDSQSNNGNWQVILVDLAKKVSFPISENTDPIGWMKAP